MAVNRGLCARCAKGRNAYMGGEAEVVLGWYIQASGVGRISSKVAT